MLTYAQNFEDVILMRALGHVVAGAYVDVGAQDPVKDSVSLAFHRAGWRGVHVEPVPSYAAALKLDRPGDVVIEAMLGSRRGNRTFYEIPETGLSTSVRSIAQKHEAAGHAVEKRSVRVETLDHVLNNVKTDVHWLKIDVEGAEQAVLEGWKASEVRPWILVIEATMPTTREESSASWAGLLTPLGYEPVYFDGINKFFLHESQVSLKDKFDLPPNRFDEFAVAEQSVWAMPLADELARLREGNREAEEERARAAETLALAQTQIETMPATIAAAVSAAEERATRAVAEHEDAVAKLGEQVAKERDAVEAARSRTDDLLTRLRVTERALATARRERDTAVMQLEDERLRITLLREDRKTLAGEARRAQETKARTEPFRKQASQLQAENRRLTEALAEVQDALAATRQSVSWRLTAPVRTGGRSVRAGARSAAPLLRPVLTRALLEVRRRPILKAPLLKMASAVPSFRDRLVRFGQARPLLGIEEAEQAKLDPVVRMPSLPLPATVRAIRAAHVPPPERLALLSERELVTHARFAALDKKEA